MEQLKIVTKLHSNRTKYFQLDLLSQKKSLYCTSRSTLIIVNSPVPLKMLLDKELFIPNA